MCYTPLTPRNPLFIYYLRFPTCIWCSLFNHILSSSPLISPLTPPLFSIPCALFYVSIEQSIRARQPSRDPILEENWVSSPWQPLLPREGWAFMSPSHIHAGVWAGLCGSYVCSSHSCYESMSAVAFSCLEILSPWRCLLPLVLKNLSTNPSNLKTLPKSFYKLSITLIPNVD